MRRLDDFSAQQAWRVRQRVEKREQVTYEDRFFVTSLPMSRLDPAASLLAVRLHWGIENDANWTFDTVWKEDTRAWVRQGSSLESLSILRILAFNIIRLLRQRVFRPKSGRAMPYRLLLDLIRMALLALEPAELESGFT